MTFGFFENDETQINNSSPNDTPFSLITTPNLDLNMTNSSEEGNDGVQENSNFNQLPDVTNAMTFLPSTTTIINPFQQFTYRLGRRSLTCCLDDRLQLQIIRR